MAVAAGVVPGLEGAEAPSWEVLAEALEANRQLSGLADGLIEENAGLRAALAEVLARDAERDAGLEKMRADLAVLQRLLFGRSSEKQHPEPPAGDGDAAGQGGDRGDRTGRERGPGARAGRRDYSHLPRVEVVWDFGGGGYCCPECGTPFTGLGSDHVTEQLDWLVIVRLRRELGPDIANEALRRWLRRGGQASELMKIASSFPAARPAILNALQVLL